MPCCVLKKFVEASVAEIYSRFQPWRNCYLHIIIMKRACTPLLHNYKLLSIISLAASIVESNDCRSCNSPFKWICFRTSSSIS
jgi:hypothetical protein